MYFFPGYLVCNEPDPRHKVLFPARIIDDPWASSCLWRNAFTADAENKKETLKEKECLSTKIWWETSKWRHTSPRKCFPPILFHLLFSWNTDSLSSGLISDKVNFISVTSLPPSPADTDSGVSVSDHEGSDDNRLRLPGKIISNLICV